MQLGDFLNAYAALNFVDRQEWMTDEQWYSFSHNPVKYLQKTRDERIWAAAQPKEGV